LTVLRCKRFENVNRIAQVVLSDVIWRRYNFSRNYLAQQQEEQLAAQQGRGSCSLAMVSRSKSVSLSHNSRKQCRAAPADLRNLER
jgi:hypothetical protein